MEENKKILEQTNAIKSQLLENTEKLKLVEARKKQREDDISTLNKELDELRTKEQNQLGMIKLKSVWNKIAVILTIILITNTILIMNKKIINLSTITKLIYNVISAIACIGISVTAKKILDKILDTIIKKSSKLIKKSKNYKKNKEKIKAKEQEIIKKEQEKTIINEEYLETLLSCNSQNAVLKIKIAEIKEREDNCLLKERKSTLNNIKIKKKKLSKHEMI